MTQKGYNQVILLASLLDVAHCDLFRKPFFLATHIYMKFGLMLGSAALSHIGAVRSEACY